MTSPYSGGLDSFTTKVAKQDKAKAADMNAVQDAIVAIETALGLDIEGTASTLSDRIGVGAEGSVGSIATRLGVMLAANGAFRSGTSFPSSPVDGQAFYRTDVDVLYIYNGVSWQPTSSIQDLFSAYNSSDQGGAGSDSYTFDVNYDTEDFDTGSCFSSNTFTAPANGKYLFTASVKLRENVSTSTVWETILYVKKNGSIFAVIGGGGTMNCSSYTHDTGVGGSIILNLSTNDTVSVYLEIANGTLGNAQVSIVHGVDKGRFTGCKISD